MIFVFDPCLKCLVRPVCRENCEDRINLARKNYNRYFKATLISAFVSVIAILIAIVFEKHIKNKYLQILLLLAYGGGDILIFVFSHIKDKYYAMKLQIEPNTQLRAKR
jgi:hypothetical protein